MGTQEAFCRSAAADFLDTVLAGDRPTPKSTDLLQNALLVLGLQSEWPTGRPVPALVHVAWAGNPAPAWQMLLGLELGDDELQAFVAELWGLPEASTVIPALDALYHRSSASSWTRVLVLQAVVCRRLDWHPAAHSDLVLLRLVRAFSLVTPEYTDALVSLFEELQDEDAATLETFAILALDGSWPPVGVLEVARAL